MLGFGEEVEDLAGLRLQVANTAPNQERTVGILRNGQPRDLIVKIGELPGKEAVASARRVKPTEPLQLAVPLVPLQRSSEPWNEPRVQKVR